MGYFNKNLMIDDGTLGPVYLDKSKDKILVIPLIEKPYVYC